MKGNSLKQHWAATIVLGLWLAGLSLANAQVARDTIETLRADLKADRNAIIAEEMKFTEKESEGFWPIYRNYRAEVQRVTDRIVELVFEYTDLYPNVPERKAGEMLKEYTRVEADLLSIKRKYLKKLGKVLPAAKVFRFAQLDNRFDLGTRLALAAWLPVMPADQPQTTSETR